MDWANIAASVVSCQDESYNRLLVNVLRERKMSDQNQVEESQESGGDSMADAFSAVALVVIAVVIAVYWVSNQ